MWRIRQLISTRSGQVGGPAPSPTTALQTILHHQQQTAGGRWTNCRPRVAHPHTIRTTRRYLSSSPQQNPNTTPSTPPTNFPFARTPTTPAPSTSPSPFAATGTKPTLPSTGPPVSFTLPTNNGTAPNNVGSFSFSGTATSIGTIPNRPSLTGTMPPSTPTAATNLNLPNSTSTSSSLNPSTPTPSLRPFTFSTPHTPLPSTGGTTPNKPPVFSFILPPQPSSAASPLQPNKLTTGLFSSIPTNPTPTSSLLNPFLAKPPSFTSLNQATPSTSTNPSAGSGTTSSSPVSFQLPNLPGSKPLFSGVGGLPSQFSQSGGLFSSSISTGTTTAPSVGGGGGGSGHLFQTLNAAGDQMVQRSRGGDVFSELLGKAHAEKLQMRQKLEQKVADEPSPDGKLNQLFVRVQHPKRTGVPGTGPLPTRQELMEARKREQEEKDRLNEQKALERRLAIMTPEERAIYEDEKEAMERRARQERLLRATQNEDKEEPVHNQRHLDQQDRMMRRLENEYRSSAEDEGVAISIDHDPSGIPLYLVSLENRILHMQRRLRALNNIKLHLFRMSLKLKDSVAQVNQRREHTTDPDQIRILDHQIHVYESDHKKAIEADQRRQSSLEAELKYCIESLELTHAFTTRHLGESQVAQLPNHVKSVTLLDGRTYDLDEERRLQLLRTEQVIVREHEQLKLRYKGMTPMDWWALVVKEDEARLQKEQNKAEHPQSSEQEDAGVDTSELKETDVDEGDVDEKEFDDEDQSYLENDDEDGYSVADISMRIPSSPKPAAPRSKIPQSSLVPETTSSFDPAASLSQHLTQRQRESESVQAKMKLAAARKREISVYPVQRLAALSSQMNVPLKQLTGALKELDVNAERVGETLVREDVARLLCEEFGFKPITASIQPNVQASLRKKAMKSEQYLALPPRPPVITVMGHVDHGKTTLLDRLRRENRAGGEAGGITQAIGAFKVNLVDVSEDAPDASADTVVPDISEDGKPNYATFLDTPGHAAFKSMRAKGCNSNCTDMVILVISAADGVQPQSLEVIQLARQNNVPIIIAVNKIDVPGADPNGILQQLQVHDVVVESLGGEVLSCNISAKTGEGISELKELIRLTSEVLQLRADRTCPGEAYLIESRVSKKVGCVANILVRNGSIQVGQYFVCGLQHGRIRTLQDENERNLPAAYPGQAVQLTGFKSLDDIADELYIVDSEELAVQILAERERLLDLEEWDVLGPQMEQARLDAKSRQMRVLRRPGSRSKRMKNVDRPLTAEEQAVKDLKENSVPVIVKADVSGSMEVLLDYFAKLPQDEIMCSVVESTLGEITVADVEHAAGIGASIVGFNVTPSSEAALLAKQKNVRLFFHPVIYSLWDDIRDLLSEKLPVQMEESNLGEAVVQQLFPFSGGKKKKASEAAPDESSNKVASVVAGCRIKSGKIDSKMKFKIIREEEVLFDGSCVSLRVGRDVQSSVEKGTECGILLSPGSEQIIKVGDVIQCYTTVRKTKLLDDSEARGFMIKPGGQYNMQNQQQFYEQ